MKTLAHFILPDSPNDGDCPNKPLGISVTRQVESTGGRGCSLRSQGIAKELALAASWKAASLASESAKANSKGRGSKITVLACFLISRRPNGLQLRHCGSVIPAKE